MKPYPQYKDSGVEWIGDVPEGWEVKGLRYLLRPGNDGIKIGPFGSALTSSQLVESGFKVYGQENVINKNFSLGSRFIGQSKFNELYVYEILPEDLLVTMMGTTGQAQLVPAQIEKGIIDSHLIRVRPKQDIIVTKYLQILINDSAYLFHQKKLQSKGSIMEGLNSSIIKSFSILLPSITEQNAIIAYLDRKTAEIDIIIAKKERLIELYEEEKAAVINHAVTKGLYPAAKMKDSGIEWLGEIPEHWDIVPLRRTILSIDQGWSPIADSSPAIENQNGVLKLSCIREGKFISSENKALLDELSFDIKTLSPTNGDILISRANTPERVGDTCFIDKNYPFLIIPDLIYRLKVNRESLHPKYLVSFLLSRSGRSQIQLDARGTSGSMVKVGQNHLRNWLIPLPLLDEQAAIVQYVETKCSHIDDIISKFKRQIELLKEYRTALISEAVTGKIDVRENMHN